MPLTGLIYPFLGTLFSNTANLVAFSYYCYNTHKGYSSMLLLIIHLLIVLPFLKKNRYFLYPIPVIAVFFIVLTFVGINTSDLFINGIEL